MVLQKANQFVPMQNRAGIMLDFVGREQQFTWYKDGYGYEKKAYKKN